ncbi:hypothetical protein BDV93DRAFT_589894 [Ceratobasidium sp. AG-I]|nr:hypothetical protein BDV93DRAFT_589894 [Ceratobasidium sp. AG-I]
MAATKENPIIFYDIGGLNGYWAPNPYKTRLTLNYKRLPYRVEYIEFGEVEQTMKAMGIPPTSKTFPYYTLPMIADPSSDPNKGPTYVSESFVIAMYLDDKYPSPKYPAVLPVNTRPLQKIFVEHYWPTIAATLVPLFFYKVPAILNANAKEYMYRSRGEDKFKPLSDSEFDQLLEAAHQKTDSLVEILELGSGNGGASLFGLGNTLTFADFAVGTVLNFAHRVEGEDSKVWQELKSWRDGSWGKLWSDINALEVNTSEVV